jgi:putative inorganic carbon (HCO3(-)) transporter
VRDKGDLDWVIRGLMAGLLFEAIVGVYQGVTGRPLGLGFLTETAAVGRQQLSVGLVNRVQGTIGHPNAYAMYLITVIPFALAYLFSAARPSSKALVSIPLGFGCLALLYTLSRTGWANLLLVFGIVLGLAVLRKRISLGAAVLIVGTAVLILLGLILFGPDMILSRLTSSDQGSAYSRVIQARTALAIIQSHPLWGVGLNNYSLFSFGRDLGTFAVWRVTPIVHNVFLLIGAETGLLGLIAFLVFLVALLAQAWQIINRAPDDTVWVAGVGVLAAIVALAVHSMVDYALLGSLQVVTQFWLLAGLCAALSQRIDGAEQNARHLSYGSNAKMHVFRSH